VALFKTPEQILQAGQDAVLRGNFPQARTYYENAALKFSKQGNTALCALAGSYAAIVSIAQSPSNASLLYGAAQSVRSLGNATLKLGLRETPASELATEIVMLATEADIQGRTANTPAEHAEKARRLRELATKFRTEAADRILVLPELFFKQSISGESKALPLSAYAEESLGESLVMENPKAAAEHYQTARLLWMQAGRQDFGDMAASRVRAYGSAAKCWFCGREISGEGIHFLRMPSELTGLIMKSSMGSVLPSFDPGLSQIYACRGCFSAVYKMADSRAVTRMQELEARINLQLNSIRESIAETQRMIARMRP